MLDLNHSTDQLSSSCDGLALDSYLSAQDEVKQLKKEIAELKELNRKTKRRLSHVSALYSKLYTATTGKIVVLNRSGKATEMIKIIMEDGFNGTIEAQCAHIAKKCFISVSYTKRLWYRESDRKRGITC